MIKGTAEIWTAEIWLELVNNYHLAEDKIRCNICISINHHCLYCLIPVLLGDEGDCIIDDLDASFTIHGETTKDALLLELKIALESLIKGY